MDNPKKTLSNYQVYEESPYRLKSLSAINKAVDFTKPVSLIDEEGTILNEGYLAENEGQLYSDTLPFIKVYNNSLKHIRELSTSSIKLLTYILEGLPKRANYVIIDVANAMEYCNYTSRASYYRGVIELLEKDFIKRSTGEQGKFFINLNYFFNGARVKKRSNKNK